MRVPEPQECVQDDHSDHAPSQCTGHSFTMQLRLSVSTGQAAPPHWFI
jgi:hypothetical protein